MKLKKEDLKLRSHLTLHLVTFLKVIWYILKKRHISKVKFNEILMFNNIVERVPCVKQCTTIDAEGELTSNK